MPKFAEVRQARIESARQLMAQQNKTALELIDDIMLPLVEVNKWAEEQSTLDLLSDLRIIAVKDGEFCLQRNKSVAINRARDIYDSNIEMVRDFYNTAKYKSDGSLFKRFAEKKTEMVNTLRATYGDAISIYQSNNYHVLKINISYQHKIIDRTGYTNHASVYYHIYIYDVAGEVLCNDNNIPPRVSIDGKDLINAQERIGEIDDLMRDLLREKSELKTLLNS